MLQDHTLRSLFNSAWSLVPPVGYSPAQAPPVFSQGPNVTTVTITSTGKTTVTVNIGPDGTTSTSSATPSESPEPVTHTAQAPARAAEVAQPDEQVADLTDKVEAIRLNQPVRGPTGYVEIDNKDWCTHLSFYEIDSAATTVRPDRHRQLAYLGDGLLECATRRILFDLYPDTTNRTAFDLRNSLVSEVALAPLSVRLGLHTHLRSSDPSMRNLSRMQSELFEAYVAAFERQYGYSAVYSWLFDLYKPLIQKLVKAVKVKPVRVPPVKDGVATLSPATGQQSYVNLRAYANSTGRMLVTKFSEGKGTGAKQKHVCTLVCGNYVTTGQGYGKMAASQVAVAKMWDALAGERAIAKLQQSGQSARATSASVHAQSEDEHDSEEETEEDSSDGYTDESD